IGGSYMALVGHAMLHGHSLWEILKGPRDWFSDSWVWPMIYYGPLQDPIWSSISVVFFVVAVALFAANLLFVLMHCLACIKRRRFDLLPYALLMPIYWILISIGAWKGFLQLFTNPFYWEKTIHGLNIKSHGIDTKI
ncbi:MAG: hypothetical protein JXN60_01595, partial [Lentisphaerae bacterium]|nr:hypothetical protein [Lentisphaerota bacterium]